MPVPIGPKCWASLFNMSQMFGVINNELYKHDNIDKEALAHLGRDLLQLSGEAECDQFVLGECKDAGRRLLGTLEDGYDTDDAGIFKSVLESISDNLQNLIACMVNTSILTADVSPDERFSAWPHEGEDWMLVVPPNRWTPARKGTHATPP